jgi:multicomponent Na+:H+ antiporter subunit F
MMFAAAALALLATIALTLLRAALGPTVFDRAQAARAARSKVSAMVANTVGSVAMLLLAVLGFIDGRPEFLDLAIVYGLLNVIGTIAVLKYFRRGDLGDPGIAEEPTK